MKKQNRAEAHTGPATAPREAQAQCSAAVGAFLDEVSTHLDLDRPSGVALGARLPFHGPDGLICRIETSDGNGSVRARPQLLLPLSREEISRLEVSCLLSIQTAVMDQLGWLLGQSSEGLLQLAPLSWTDEAQEVARELDLGSAVGRMVLAMLRPGAPPETGHSH